MSGMFGAMVAKAFGEADKDKSGHVDLAECETVLKKYSKDLGLDEVTPEHVELCYKELDKDDNGKIDEKEFGKLIQLMIKKKTK